MDKKCSKCQETKNISEFHKYKNGKFGVKHYCKSCCNEDAKKRYWSSDEYRKVKGKYFRSWRYNIKKELIGDIIDRDFVNCEICNKEISGKKLVIDHDHKTSKIRGILCHRCNALLGFATDDVSLLESCIEYLKIGKSKYIQ